MKLSILLIYALIVESTFSQAQNATSGQVGLYGAAYSAATTMLSGGSIFVGNGGNWYLGGSISSANKGNPNSPSALGRSEVITFDGTGKVSGAITTPGGTGNYINGYAATTGTAATSLLLPVGGSSAVYPFTVPAGAAVKVAYFDGSGSTTNVPVNGTPTVEFSQYYDMPSGWPAGTYSLAYPSGLVPGYNAILSSATGSSFSLVTDIPNLSTTAGTVASVSLPLSAATRLYLSTSPTLLPIHLDYFHGSRKTGYNLLQWAASDPWDVDRFQLYKHGTQTSQFAPLCSISASDTLTNYTFQDYADTSSAYYQLALIGKDRSVSMSQIVFLSGEDNTTTVIALFPNPASSAISVTLFSSTGGELTCSIFDMKGQKLATKLVTADGNVAFQWDISSFPKGIYTLNIRNNQTGKVQNIPFVKI